MSAFIETTDLDSDPRPEFRSFARFQGREILQATGFRCDCCGNTIVISVVRDLAGCVRRLPFPNEESAAAALWPGRVVARITRLSVDPRKCFLRLDIADLKPEECAGK